MSNPKRSFNLFRALGFTTNAQPSNSNNNNNTSISSSSSSSSNNNERDHSNDPVTKSTADLQAMLRKSTSNLFAVTSNNAQTPTSATTPTDSLTNKWGDVRASLRMRKLWTEYSRAKDEETKAELLNQIVVLFNRVCPSCDSENFVTCFGDGQTFAFTLCRKFVAQVVKILGKSIMSTKAATTQSLIDFFASSKQIGSQMVECLQVLADKKTYIPAIAEAKLASTLVKVLEVLVSTLPEEYAQFHSPDCQDPQKGMAIAEEKICLLLRSLVRHSDIVFELKNADSISALIRNITMKDCPRENYHTRERSLQVIGAILDATEDNSFADHLHKKKCVSSLVNALKGIDTTQFQTVAIVVLTIETLLKKSIAHSTLLLRDFASANGYQMAQDAIVKCEQWIEKDPVLMNKILDAATELVFIGDVDQAPPEDDLQHIYFKLANIPREHRIRSITAFQALANAFLRTDKPELQSQLLERILYIFAVNPINYPIVHHLHNIALFIRNLDHLQEEIQTSVLKVLEYIVTGVNFMPFEELCNLVLLLKVDISMRLMCNIFTTIIKLIKFDSKYKDIFRDAKLIETIVYLFKQQDTTQPTENDRKYHREVLLPTMADLLLWMLEKSPANMLKFREADGVGVMQSLLTNETVRASALRVFQKLVAQDTLQNERDVSCLIEVLQTTPHSNLTLLTEIFNALKRMFHLNKKAKDAFRKNDGFVVTVSVLVRVQWPQDANLQHETFVMMESLFSMLTAALADHFKNKDFFNKNIGCSAMKSSLQLSGLLTAKTQHKIFQFLLDLATERSISADGSSDVYICGFLIPSHPRVWNPFALGLILDLVKSLELDFQSQVLKVFIYLAEAGQSILEAMSTVELGLFLLENYSSAVTDEEHLLHDDLLRILELIGSYRFTPLEWRKLLKMVHDDNQPLFLLQSLVRMSRNGSNTPFFELTDSSSAYLPNLDDRAWGPGTGYSFSCWIYFEKLGRDGTTSEAPSRPFVLLYLATEDKRCYLKLQLHPGGHFEIQTSPKTKPIDFTGFKFEEKQWYHVVVAHQRYRLQASIAVLYVNGKVIETKKVPFIAQNASGGQISGYIGAPLSVADVPVDGQLQHDDITWRIGPCLLYDDVMTDEMVTSHFVAGPSYTGCFQGDYLHGIGLLSDPIFPTYAQLIQNMDTSLLLSTLSSSDAPHQALSVVPQPLPSEKVVFAFNAKSVKLTGYIEDKKKPEAEATAENDTNYAYFLADIKDTGEKQLFARLDGKPVICCPSSISNDILNVNGLATILSLIDGAQTPEYLDASLSLLASLMVEPKILKEMERLGGYQIIGNFLRKKSSFMSPVILDTLWGIVTAGSVANKEIASNLRACKRFLLDYEIWKNADADLQKNLFNKLNSLVAETNAYAPWNHLRLRKTKIVTLLLHILHEAPPLETVETIATLLKSILAYRMLEEDVSHILSFLLTTLGVFVEVSKPGTTFAPSYDDLSRPIFKSRSSRKQPFGINQSIPIRNVIMRLLLDLLTGKHSETNIDLFHKVVSINWFFQFMDHGAHPVTAILALKLLVVLILARPAFATKFRNNNGFSLLKLVLGPYCNQDEVYSSLFSLLLGNNTIDICAQVEDLAELFSFLPDSKEKEDIPVQAPQVAGVVLRLVRLNAEFTDNYPLFSRQSTKQYFLTYSTRKVSLAQRRWAMVKVMVCALNGFRRATQWAEAQRSRKSGNNNDTIITNVNEEPSISGALSASQAVSAESSTTPQRLGGSSITIDPAALKLQPALLKRYHSPEEISTRTTINNIVIKFVSYLFEHSQTFKQICKTTEVLDELAGIIFAKQINLSSASFYRRAKLMSEGIQASSRNLGTTLMAAFAAPTDITHSTSQNLDDETKPSSPRNTSEIDPYSSVDDESGRRTPTSDTLKEVSVVSETGDIYDSANENSDDEEVRSLSALSTGSPISTGFFYRTSSTSDQMLSQSNRSSSPNSELDSPASFNTSSPLGPITANADAVFDNTTSDCIFEFMKIIIAWSFIHTSKGTSTLEDILEAYPPHTPRKWVVSYQDRIILSTIDYFSSDLSSAKLLHDGGKLMQNLARFSTLLIDRKAMDMFPSHDERVLDFFSLLVTRFEETTADPYSASSGSRVSRGKSVFVVTNAVSNLTNLTHNLANPIIANRIGGVNRSEYLAVVYHSLSKMFLHLLSFTNDKAPDVIEDVLNKLIGHLDIVLHPNNKDDEFLTCLCYIMYGFLLNDSTKVRSEALKFWKLILALRSKTPSLASILSYKNPKGETVDLLNNGFDKLLDKDYSSFMEWFSLNTETVAKYFEEHLHKSWRKYSDAENHARTVNKRERLAKQRNRTAKEQANIVDRFELIAALRKACSAELAKIKKEEAATARNRREQDIVRSNYAADQWQSICDYMEREKSIWRPADAVPDRQRLDFTEGPFRMRKKLEKCKANDIQHLVSSPTKPERRNPMPRNNSVRDDMLRPSLAAIEQAASTPPTEGQGKYLFSQFDKIEQLQGSATEKLSEVQLSASVQHEDSEEDEEDDDYDSEPEQESVSTEKPEETAESSQQQQDAGDDDNEIMDDDDDSGMHQKIQRLLEPGDKILHLYNCLRVTGLDAVAGIFLMCSKNIYIIDDYRIDENGEIVEVFDEQKSSWSNSFHEGSKKTVSVPSHSSSSSNLALSAEHGSKLSHKCRKWSYNDIRELHKRRYLLRPVALEFFCTDGRNYLVVFFITERDEVYNKLLSLDLPRYFGPKKEDKSWRKSMTKRWQKGEISNFQYLMFLNTLAGRSYNDLTQYPVFPWVLSDYTSEELDLTDPRVYRDLSKPMGALTEKRKQEFQQRFENWEDPTGQIPRFHYGTHYSSAGIVLYYLIRLEPFTKQSIKLQGGRFDHADRLFYSIQDTWTSASETAMSDVKELIPEFFYLPEFLTNHNKVNLGTRQTGQVVDDVELPPWAKNDPKLFILRNRQALESPYVSQHLHEWIDLIFGYKQTGKAAEEAMNVFYYLTYEGAVDIDRIENEVEKRATIAQINNFGQTPHQLFTKPHPPRQQLHPVIDPKVIYMHPEDLIHTEVKNHNEAVGQIHIAPQDPLRVISMPKNRLLVNPRCHKYFQWGFPDNSLRLRLVGSDQTLRVFEGLHSAQITCAAISDDGKLLALGGNDCVVSVWKVGKVQRNRTLNLKQRFCGHLRPISCIAMSSSYSVIISGSEDKTAIIWDMNRLHYVQRLVGHEGTVRDIVINHVSGEIITCAGTSIFVWNINGDLLAVSHTPKHPIMRVAITGGPEWLDNNLYITGHDDGCIYFWSILYSSTNKNNKKPDDDNNNNNSSSSSSRSRSSSTASNDSNNTSLNNSLTAAATTTTATTIVRRTSQSPIANNNTLLRGCYELLLEAEHQTDTRAAITSLFVTPDQKRLYAGDVTGSVVCFHMDEGPSSTTATTITATTTTTTAASSVGAGSSSSITSITSSGGIASAAGGILASVVVGGQKDHWIKDNEVVNCARCATKFTTTKRRHHCRNCGRVVCAACSSKSIELPQLNFMRPVRVCEDCFELLTRSS